MTCHGCLIAQNSYWIFDNPYHEGRGTNSLKVFNSLKYFSDILRLYKFEWLPILVFKDGL